MSLQKKLQVKPEELQLEIEKMRQEIRSDSYSMSIGELISLYENQEIDIHPEFQRFYRWSNSQKTRFIESILLGIPIPPIFVFQREDGVWEVIDGLQRLSTIYEFLGKLTDEHHNNIQPLVLEGTQYLPSLEGKKWDDSNNPQNSFTTSQRLLVKRAKINVIILLPESDRIVKYELFQRLNTGGSLANPQEIRNCILVMFNPKMYQWLKDLSQQENFQECISLSERNLDEQYDVELVLRFVILRTLEEEKLRSIKDLGGFLTDKMVEMAQQENYDYEREAKAFNKTFEILNSDMGNNSFRRYDSDRGKFLGGFLVSAYEVIALGIGYNYEKIHHNLEINIENLVKNLWKNSEYTAVSGSGISAQTRISKIVPLGRRIFQL